MTYKWLLKAAVQGTIALFPQRDALNYLFQRYITRNVLLSEHRLHSCYLAWCSGHLDFFQKARGRLPEHVLELGTGWLPAIPLAMALCGIPRVTTIDIHDLKRPYPIENLLSLFYNASFEKLQAALPLIQQERFEALLALRGQPYAQVFAGMGVTFLIADARQTGFPDASIDCFVSNTTLEHIPPEVMAGIWKEFRRIATPDAVMSHLIDMSDHYSHFDSGISPYHFLGHERLLWTLVNNRLQYQNRLRAVDYVRLHEAAGFRILHEQTKSADPYLLSTIRLARAFQDYTPDELLPTQSWLVSEPVA